MVTNNELDKLEALARAADPNGANHLITHYRNSAVVKAEEAWRRAAKPATVLQLIALARRSTSGSDGTAAAGRPFKERDPTKPASQQGLYNKFYVSRVDGSDAYGGKHFGCCYFVLDLTHDQHAPAALRAYADSCSGTHPELAADLRAEFGTAAATSGSELAFTNDGREPDWEAYAVAEQDAKDAARYRWLRVADLNEIAAGHWQTGRVIDGVKFDDAIDAAMSASQGKTEEAK